MDTLGRRLTPQYRSGDSGWTIGIASLRAALTENAATPLLILLAAVALVLLIACVNVANLLLARATARAGEFALRAALGAGQARIVRQLLTESAVLALLGAAAGAALAFFLIRGLTGLLPATFPRAGSIEVDRTVLSFALLLSLAASLLFGLAPALYAARPARRKSHNTARHVLIAAEVSLATMLLIAAGLLLRTFAALNHVDPGFNPSKLLKVEVSLPRFEYSTPTQWIAFSRDALSRIQAVPELRNTAAAVPLPLADNFVSLPFSIRNRPPVPPGRSLSAHYVAVTQGYFHLMNIPLLGGRFFTSMDSPAAPRVTIISRELARRFFPHTNPIGGKLVFSFPPDPPMEREIVGVAGDVRDDALNRQPAPMMYVPYAQAPFWGVCLVTRTTLSAAAAAGLIEAKVHEVDRDLPGEGIEWMSDSIETSLSPARLRTWLLGLFGAVALLLAAAGIFGVVSYSVSRRTREIGVRMALGARRRDVVSLIAGQGMAPVCIGITLGLAGSLALTRFLSGLLYGVKSTDLTTFAAAALVLILVALLAAWLPARRAARVDPITALRCE